MKYVCAIGWIKIFTNLPGNWYTTYWYISQLETTSLSFLNSKLFFFWTTLPLHILNYLLSIFSKDSVRKYPQHIWLWIKSGCFTTASTALKRMSIPLVMLYSSKTDHRTLTSYFSLHQLVWWPVRVNRSRPQASEAILGLVLISQCAAV